MVRETSSTSTNGFPCVACCLEVSQCSIPEKGCATQTAQKFHSLQESVSYLQSKIHCFLFTFVDISKKLLPLAL